MINFEIQLHLHGPEDLNDELSNKEYILKVNLFSESGSHFDPEFTTTITPVDDSEMELLVRLNIRNALNEETIAEDKFAKIVCPKLRLVHVVIADQHGEIIHGETIDPPATNEEGQALADLFSQDELANIVVHTYATPILPSPH